MDLRSCISDILDILLYIMQGYKASLMLCTVVYHLLHVMMLSATKITEAKCCEL